MNENEFNPAQDEVTTQPEDGSTPEVVQKEEQPATEEAKKASSDKRSPAEIAIAVVAVVLIIAVLVAVVVGGLGDSADSDATEATGDAISATTPPDGNHDDVTCKGTYTVSDEQAAADASKVIATLGDQEMTNADLQIYYWMQVVSFLNDYSYYIPYIGLDYTQPLDTQMSMSEPEWTWQQYFLYAGLDAWTCYESLAQEAIACGFDQQSEDYQTYIASVREDVTASAEAYGYASIEDMLAAIVGPGSSEDAYFDYLQTYYLGYLYFNELYESRLPTAEEIEAYFDANAATYSENGVEKDDSIYIDVRHILVMPEGGTTDDSGATTYTDEAWAAAEAEAQALLDQWLAGEATEESFGELANLNSDDSDGTDGGLYTYVAEGEMVPNFNDWCFDEARQVGDYGIVRTEYGYHVMYFVGSNPIWYVTAENDLNNEIGSSIVPEIQEKYETSFDYTSMVLGYVDLAAQQ